MALKAATKPARLNDDQVPEVPDEIPRGRGDRPKIRALRPDGTDDPAVMIDYTRASTLGKALEDQTGLGEWKKRMVAFGIGHDPALHLAAASIATTSDEKDKKALGKIAEEALVIARAGAGAMKGTAFHSLSDQRQNGASLAHLPALILNALDAYDRLMESFEVVAMEQFVVCDELETAGTYDRLLSPRWPLPVIVDGQEVARIEPGELLIDDTKSGSTTEYFGAGFSVQQTVYANGVPYSHKHGRGLWPGQGSAANSAFAPRRDWSLIMHIPVTPPKDAEPGWLPSDDAALWWVNLTEGMELARLARTVRANRRRDDLFYPCEVPARPWPSSSDEIGLVAQIRAAADWDALMTLHEAHADVWDDECTAAADERADELDRLVTS